MISNFSDKAQKIIAVAESIAFDFGHTSVGSEHLLLAFLKIKDNKIKKLLESQNITYEIIKKDFLNIFEKKETFPFYMEYTPSLRSILEKAIKESKSLNEDKVSVDVLALSLFKEEDSLCKEILSKYNCDFNYIISNIHVEKISPLDNIDELTNLNKKMSKSPTIVYDRDKEISMICRVLLRKQKPNVLLIGEPGVGKSALIEYLAYKMNKKEVMDELKNKTIYELDISSVVAGTKYRGEFEEKLKKIIYKIKEDKNAIIFIDEFHNIIGAGGAEGAIDTSNILKPYLARGDIHCIGATTSDEYSKIIEKEKAIERRFQTIVLEEPNVEKTISILKKVSKEYERYHSIKIDESICKEIVKLTKKYVPNKHFPDKAIDVLDCSCVLAKEQNKDSLDVDCVVSTIESFYNVRIKNNVIKDNLFNELNEKILGQKEQIKKIVEHLEYIDKGIRDDNKPLGVFLFIGSSGVGKSELAKELANAYFGRKDAYIKLDMAEFKESGSVSKIIGTSPGYVGFDNQTLLINRLKSNPCCVILLDEIEKAHKDVLNLFLNIFDEGYFYDNNKNKIDFTSTIIVMTSNASFSYEKEKVGFIKNIISEEERKKELNKYFSYEFLNRIDEVIYFNNFSDEDIKNLTNKYLNEYKEKCYFEFDEEYFISNILEKDEVKKYGARYIKREVKKNVLKQIEKQVEVS